MWEFFRILERVLQIRSCSFCSIIIFARIDCRKKGAKATTLPAVEELVVGAVAGACSKLFTTPISNIVTRKQTASMISSRSSTTWTEPSVQEIVSKIRNEKGIQGFWSGYSASLVLTLNPSITFFLYEFFKRTLLPRAQREDPGARVTFLMAAISKAIASTTTYPFSLAKKRAQAGSSPPVDSSSAKEIKTELSSASNASNAKTAGRKSKGLAEQSTVFNTIVKIYREEGWEALYEGVWGEVMRGFLGHGITMIVKETVHKFIISTYYWLLKALNKYPSPEALAAQAKQVVGDSAENTTEVMKESYANISERVGSAIESGRQTLNDTVASTSNTVSNAVQQGRNAIQPAIDTAQFNSKTDIKGTSAASVDGASAGSVDGPGGAAAGSVQSADKFQSQVAGNLMGNAQDMLGQKPEIGKK